MEHNLRNSRNACRMHIEIKSDQNDLVTLYKIFFCVQQKKVVWNDMRVSKWWQNLLALSSSLAPKQCFTVKCFSMWQQLIIMFVVFVVNSVFNIYQYSFLSYFIYSFIYSNWRPYDPSKHSRGNLWAGWARFGEHDFEGSHSKFSAQGLEFLATALTTPM